MKTMIRAGVLLVGVSVLGWTATTQATKPDDSGQHKVWVCHATSGAGELKNGFNLIEVDIASTQGQAHLAHATTDPKTNAQFGTLFDKIDVNPADLCDDPRSTTTIEEPPSTTTSVTSTTTPPSTTSTTSSPASTSTVASSTSQPATTTTAPENTSSSSVADTTTTPVPTTAGQPSTTFVAATTPTTTPPVDSTLPTTGAGLLGQSFLALILLGLGGAALRLTRRAV